ncbi:odorant receptor 67d-like [Musca vetustissima]|uniref:odorant receptor 67d-like n=1 Tax=Musca vetustissima TaxID=27455 RepID=UPI002AB72B2F|nr:odorant receptor 67d-like [Musca vetustissima]
MAGKQNLTPSERFAKLMNVIQLFAKLVGANVLDPNFRLNSLTAIMYILCFGFFSFNFYTIYVGVFIDNKYTIILQSLCIITVGVQGVTKHMSALLNAKLMSYICSELQNLYEEFECKQQSYIDLLNNNLVLVKRTIFVLFQVNFILTVAAFAIPIFYYLVLNEEIDIIKLMVPGVDPNTAKGNITYRIFHNDDITDIVYDCKWYDLSVSEQKMVLIMLRVSQNPPIMTIGDLMPLSMNTALQLTKSIYTIAMLLNEFVQ